MSALQSQLFSVLRRAAERLREAPLPQDLAAQLDRLAAGVDQPCVVAVAGRMKAGKSTFINALLGADLAPVGARETTATVNYFRYGQPDPEHPARCHWRDGRVTDEPRAFLDGLQGTEPETLRRAGEIDHLEYRLLNAHLQDVTLVDTPGTASVVDEHQDRTAEWLALEGQLRERRTQESERLAGEADAVIYLVGPVARRTDEEFLEEFGRTTGGRARARNAVGVLAKIDLQPEIIERRGELAKKIAGQLREELNTVVPVSAGLQRALDGLLENDGAGMARMREGLARVPPARLAMMLDSDELYLLPWDDCPLSVDERQSLLGAMPWTVFATLARALADPSADPDAAVERLTDLAGFGPLRQILERRFFTRGRLLRCHRIAGDARKLLREVRFRHLPQVREQDREARGRLDRFVLFVRLAEGDAEARRELEAYLAEKQRAAGEAERLEEALVGLERELDALFHRLEADNADVEVLQQLDDHDELFSGPEREELRRLFGLYGMDRETRLSPGGAAVEGVEDRAQYWSETAEGARSASRREVARYARSRYEMILDEIMEQGACPSPE
jgi:hypothetical protein